ncbi:MAG: hypothetical protein GBAus27B_000293 [Mycoplasmataceae bacterium]|nr:MAG: hypothetical protein GBAus27B_000293 [Mycoplasmataceae bacterium]
MKITNILLPLILITSSFNPSAQNVGSFNSLAEEANCNEKIELGSDKIQLSLLEEKLQKFLELTNWGKDTSSSKFTNLLSKIPEKYKNIFQAIAPGTKWCGDGDRAKDDEDLGLFKETDACCRAHDKCDSNIIAGSVKANLKNDGFLLKMLNIAIAGFINV